jgi:hypothetical protein
MINLPDRRSAVELIKEAVCAGSSAQKACEELEISLRSCNAGMMTVSSRRTDDPRPNVQRRRIS